ncbi:hypothetical protein [Sinorhizobium americanum]|uniref:hypothetical protein n=1 Tax=Sinorhizobium americanum TaxID=194963 RepID=UPI0007DA2B46|nr:hypothetical protein [Sinorhizobium americanum]OAP39588.1 hypothetical protein ATC00_08225 [Sinorhizobium americanum]
MSEERATDQGAINGQFAMTVTTDLEEVCELQRPLNRYLDEPPSQVDPDMSRLTVDEKRLCDEFYDWLIARGVQPFTGGDDYFERLDDGTVITYPAP